MANDWEETTGDLNVVSRVFVYCLVALVLIGVLGIIGYYVRNSVNQATRPARLSDPIREEAMSARMNVAWQALQAAELDVAAAQKKVSSYEGLYGADASKWPQGKRAEYQQDQTHLTNAIAAYNRACGNYTATYADEFQRVAAPKDLPQSCSMMAP